MMRFGSICRISLHAARPAPRRILTVAVATAVAGCGAPVASGTAGPSAGVWSYVYSCAGGVRFSARMTADAAYLTLDGRQSELVRDPESPDRYTGDGYTLTREDEDATLVTPGGSLGECEGEAASNVWEDASMRGVTYRAVGQEPGWYVEVTPDRSVLFVGDYGESVVLGGVPTVATDEARGRITYSSAGPAGSIVVSVDHHACIDVMSGEGYPTRAFVTVDGATHQGCGLPLER